MPLLRRLPPEFAHVAALRALRLGLAPAPTKAATDPVLAVSVLGLRFANPVGLAAGFDKDAIALRGLARLGFGFLEAGTVTQRPQRGNPRPRLFRLPADHAAINRMGFNNAGLACFASRLSAARAAGLTLPLGVNIGINRDAGDPERDYPALIAALAPLADYITINVSSPNTPGLRDLQAADRLARILQVIAGTVPRHPPLLVKLAPDLDDAVLADVVEVTAARGVAGLILSNTTTARPGTLRDRRASEKGGLSGAPLFAPSTRQLARAYLLAHGRLVLIGVGGVASGADAWVKLRAGASLVQLYTAFAEHGPALLPRLLSDLAGFARAANLARIDEAVGRDAPRLAEAEAWNT
jgi:dihydroorotate dehydrogenase